MIKTKEESVRRKGIGRSFQERHRRAVLEKFKSDYDFLTEEDITSCPSCSHGEDIKLSQRFREIYPYSTECKRGATEHKTIYKQYNQAMRQARDLALTTDIVPVLAIQGSHNSTLIVLSEQDHLRICKENADLKLQIERSKKH